MASKRHAPTIEINPRLQDRFTGTTVICQYCNTKQFITDNEDPPLCLRCRRQTIFLHTHLLLQKIGACDVIAIGFTTLKEQLRMLINKYNLKGCKEITSYLLGRYFILCCLESGGPYDGDNKGENG